MKYALVNTNNLVVNIIEWDGVSLWSPPEDCKLVKYTVEEVSPGFTYSDGTFIPPYKEPVVDNAPRTIPKSVVINRLTDDQVVAAVGLMTQKQRELWRSPDLPAISVENAEVLKIITAIGADPAIILAVE